MIETGSKDISDVLVAFYGALGAVEDVAKTQTADTGKYSYRYADLGDVLDEVKRAARLFKLEVSQGVSTHAGAFGDYMSVQTTLFHESGQWVAFNPLVMPLGKDPQAIGSSMTYARRYALLSIFGIAPEDDDGRAATVAAQTQPGRRTEAERIMREAIGAMDPKQKMDYMDDFRREFGMSLTDLPAGKHGAALTWSKDWIEGYVPPSPDGATPEMDLSGA
jgi:hypothetical protein